MATTSPDNLWSPDSAEGYDLTVDLAAMQDSTQAALVAIRTENPPTYIIGTNAERLGLTSPVLREGLRFWTTDTRIEWVYSASAWRDTRAGTLLKYAQVQPNSLLTTSFDTVSGLSLAGCPTGVPVIVDIDVSAVNGASGSSRFIEVQAFNGPTAIETKRRFALPLIVNDGNAYTISYPVEATPASDTWTLKLGVDLDSSVILWKAALRLTIKP